MTLSQSQEGIEALRKKLDKAALEVDEYFSRVSKAFSDAVDAQPDAYSKTLLRDQQSGFWTYVAARDRDDFVPAMSHTLATLVNEVIEAAKSSPLISEIDFGDLRISLREMLASLRLQRYLHWGPEAVADEDRLLYVEPAGQKEEDATPVEARRQFVKAFRKVKELTGLVFPSETPLATAIAMTDSSSVKRYRPNTAFIMMWISKEHPELEDVKECIKNGFKEFGIEAVRSDEIEHQDTITSRILDEITSSEFQIADLTGERPSVYYEVGFAHAIGKRPILYRRIGTPLHFDLSVHNVPEYENITDLRKQLRKRLSAITNKSVEDAE